MKNRKRTFIMTILAVVLGVSVTAGSAGLSYADSLPLGQKEIAKMQAVTKQAMPGLRGSDGRADEGIAIDATNFPDVNFRNKLISLPFGADKVLSAQDIAATTSLDVSSSEISSLKGIEFFTSLKDLDCSKNKIKAVEPPDATTKEPDLSKNIKLEKLNCSQNPLTKLDITANTALTYLNVSKNTALTTLDVSKNAALTELDCEGANLGALDVSKNRALTDLNCSGNQITALDVSRNTSLKNLNCVTNKLTALDVSQNAALVSLACDDNSLKKLDVSKNPNLLVLLCTSTELKVLDVSKNTKLKSLYCNNNQIQALDLSSNTDLTKLFCGKNQLQTLDVSTSVGLTELGCENNRIQQLLLPASGTMTYLNCQNNKLMDLKLPSANISTCLLDGQQNTIGLDADTDTYDLKNIAPSIDGAKISNLFGASSHEGTILKGLVQDQEDKVIYTYDCGNGKKMQVTLKVVAGNKWELDNDTDPVVKITDWIYGESPSVPTATAQSGTVEYSYSASEEGPYTGGQPTTVGTWYVKAFVAPTDTYSGLESAPVSFKITQNPTPPATDEPQGLTAAYQDQLKDVELPIGWRWADPEQVVEVGEHFYDATRIVDDVNYDYSEEPTYVEENSTVKCNIKVTVQKGANEWNPEPSIANWTYNQEPSKPKGASKYGRVVFTYSENQNGPFTEQPPTKATPVTPENQSWYMKASVAGTDNYTSLEKNIEFKIEKAKPSYTTPENLTATYGQKLSEINIDIDPDPDPDGVLSWMDDTKPVGDVGTRIHEAQFTPTDTDNFATVENIKIPIVVKKATENDWTTDLSMVSFTYGDTDKKPTAEPKYGKVKFVYSGEENGTYTSNPPVNAGTWYVKAIVAGTDNHSGLESGPVPFTISPAKAKPVVSPSGLTAMPGTKRSEVSLPAGWVWAGNDVVFEDKGSFSFVATYAVDDKNYDYKNPLIDGYDSDLSLVKRTLTVDVTQVDNAWVEPLSITGWAFGEEAHAPMAKAKHGTPKFTYSSVETGPFTKDTPPEKPGTWYVRATVEETVNYKGLESTRLFTISKAEPEYTIPQNLTVSYGEKLSEIQLPERFSWMDGTQTATPAGKQTFKAKYTPADPVNYETMENIEVPVTVKAMPNSWTDDIAITGWTFGETPKTPTAKAMSGTPEFVYSKSKTGTYTSTPPTSGGTWYVKAIVKEGRIYGALESEPLEFIIKKGTAPAIEEPKNLAGNSGDALSTITLTGGWKWVNPSQIIGLTSSTYNAMLPVEDENYDYSAVTGYDSATHSVKRSLNVKTSTEQNLWTTPPSIKDWAYGQKASTPEGAAKYGTVAFTYGSAQAGPFTATVPTKAGTWYMKASVAAASGYTELNETVQFTITKATPTYTLPTGLTATYGDLLSTITLQTGFTWMDGTKTVGNAGNQTHKVKYTPTDAANYVTAENLDVTVAVKKATNSWKTGLIVEGWTYGDTTGAPTAAATFGDIVYTYSSKSEGTYTTKKPTDAGTWYVKAEVTETDNYTGMKAGPEEFTIEQKSSNALTIPEITEDTDLNQLEIKDGDKVLEKGEDYDISKKTKGKTVTVTIKFKGNYKGTVTRTYTIGSGSSGNTGDGDNGGSGSSGSSGSSGDSGSKGDGNSASASTDKASGTSASDSNGTSGDNATAAENLAKLNDSVKKVLDDLAVATGDVNLKPWLIILVVSLIIVLIAAKKPGRKKKK